MEDDNHILAFGLCLSSLFVVVVVGNDVVVAAVTATVDTCYSS